MRWRTPNSTAMLGVVLRLSSPVLPFDASVSTARRPMPATSHKDYGEPWWNMNHTVSWYIHRSHRKHGFRPSRSYITRLASRFERQNSHIWTAISSNPPISRKPPRAPLASSNNWPEKEKFLISVMFTHLLRRTLFDIQIFSATLAFDSQKIKSK